MSAVGPMGRFVDDLALLLPLIAGRDDVDPFVQGCPVGDPASVAVGSLRVGIYDDDGVWPVSAGTGTAVAAAGAALVDAGCEVEQASPPDVSEATELFFALMAADGGARARDDLAAAGGPARPQMSRLARGSPAARARRGCVLRARAAVGRVPGLGARVREPLRRRRRARQPPARLRFTAARREATRRSRATSPSTTPTPTASPASPSPSCAPEPSDPCRSACR